MSFQPLFSELLSELLEPLLAAVQRVFITANPVLMTHFPLENTKTLTGNFRVGALCVLPTAATTVTLHGQLASASNYFKVLSTGFASINIGGSVVTSTVLATKDRKLRIYDVELSGNDFLFHEDGVTIDTVTDAVAAANSLVIDVLCQSNGSDFFDGTYSDPKITDLATPSNSESWAINRALPANTEQSSSGNNILTYNNAPDSTRELFTLNTSVTPNRWGGKNIVVNGGFDTDTDWAAFGTSTISGGVYNVSGTTGFGSVISQDMGTILNNQYLFEFDIISNDSGEGIKPRVQNDFGSTVVSVGSHAEIMTPTSAQTFEGLVNASGSPFAGSIDNLSVKRIVEVA